jgi:hypothetical protein
MKQWNNLEINLNSPTFITKDLLKININKFWSDKMSHLDDNHHVLFILRLKFENNQIITASTLKKIDKTNKNDIIEYLFDKLSVSNESYSTTLIKSIIFSYGIREGKIDHSINDISVSNIDTKFQLYYNNKLPIVNTGNPSEYGKILSGNNDHYFINVSNKIFIVLKSLIINNQKVNNIKFIKNGREVNNWTDTITGKNSIVREIGKSIYYYENMESYGH